MDARLQIAKELEDFFGRAGLWSVEWTMRWLGRCEDQNRNL